MITLIYAEHLHPFRKKKNPFYVFACDCSDLISAPHPSASLIPSSPGGPLPTDPPTAPQTYRANVPALFSVLSAQTSSRSIHPYWHPASIAGNQQHRFCAINSSFAQLMFPPWAGKNLADSAPQGFRHSLPALFPHPSQNDTACPRPSRPRNEKPRGP